MNYAVFKQWVINNNEHKQFHNSVDGPHNIEQKKVDVKSIYWVILPIYSKKLSKGKLCC